MAATTLIQISNVFNLMVQEPNSGLLFYKYGYRQEANINRDNNFDQGNITGELFPRLMFEIPQFIQDVDTVEYFGYNDEIPIVLYFDDLQDYQIDGTLETDNTIEQQSKLLDIAKIFMANLREVLCKKYRIGHFSKPRYVPRTNAHNDRLIVWQVSFTLTRLVPCVEASAQIDLDNLPATLEETDLEKYATGTPPIRPFECPSSSNSMLFDGVNENIEYGTDVAFDFQDTSSFTFSTWVKFNSFNNGHFISKYSTGLTTGTYVSAGLGNRIRFDLQSNAGGGLGLISVRSPLSGLVTGQWYHVLVTYNGNGLASGTEMYINGAPVTKSVLFDTLGGGNISNSENLKLGGDNTSGLYLNGNLYETRIWNTVLTPAQALAEATLDPTTGLAPSPVLTANLIARNQTGGGNEAIFGSSEWNFANNSTITTSATSNNMEVGDRTNDLP